MSDVRNAAFAEVPFSVMERLLNLPSGVQITGAYWDPSRDALRFRIVGASLPAVRSGEVLQGLQARATLQQIVLMDWPIT